MEKKLAVTVQFTTTAPHPEEEIVEWFEKLMALHLNDGSYYTKWFPKSLTPE